MLVAQREFVQPERGGHRLAVRGDDAGRDALDAAVGEVVGPRQHRVAVLQHGERRLGLLARLRAGGEQIVREKHTLRVGDPVVHAMKTARAAFPREDRAAARQHADLRTFLIALEQTVDAHRSADWVAGRVDPKCADAQPGRVGGVVLPNEVAAPRPHGQARADLVADEFAGEVELGALGLVTQVSRRGGKPRCGQAKRASQAHCLCCVLQSHHSNRVPCRASRKLFSIVRKPHVSKSSSKRAVS